jgi:hypothetical protein
MFSHRSFLILGGSSPADIVSLVQCKFRLKIKQNGANIRTGIEYR